MADRSSVPVREVAVCATQTVRLLARHRLHIRDTHVGSRVALPDGRSYVVFRETSRDQDAPPSSEMSEMPAPVLLAVWFRLRAIPPGARVRRWLFERLCILNTVLFAGMDGYLVKLWMVDPPTSEYAGLYSWASSDAADRYGDYITAVLRPLSVPGSIGYHVYAEMTLDEHLGGRARQSLYGRGEPT